MGEFHSSEELEHISAQQQAPEQEGYTPRPKWQLVLAWILAVIVVFAFLGTCYWMMFYGV